MRRQATALAAGIVLLRAALPSAHAQQNTSTHTAEASDNTKVAEVVVTGSRIRRESGFDYPVPVAVIGGDAIRGGGYTFLGDSLANLPQALATTGIQNTSGSLFAAGATHW
jgi:outer membrane receptor protein involved in Fe transport